MMYIRRQLSCCISEDSSAQLLLYIRGQLSCCISENSSAAVYQRTAQLLLYIRGQLSCCCISEDSSVAAVYQRTGQLLLYIRGQLRSETLSRDDPFNVTQRSCPVAILLLSMTRSGWLNLLFPNFNYTSNIRSKHTVYNLFTSSISCRLNAPKRL